MPLLSTCLRASGSLFVALVLSACHGTAPVRLLSAHAVAVQAVAPVTGSPSVPLTGRVTPRGNGEPSAGVLSDYRITVAIPDGAQTTLTAGQTVAVTLPLIHHQDVRATVEAVAPGEVRLLLAHQVQELSDQEVRVQISLRGQGLFQIPFTAVYSPRGLAKRVMVARGDKADAVDVKVVALSADERNVLVTGKLQAGDPVVVQGLDNLLPGDPVQLIEVGAK